MKNNCGGRFCVGSQPGWKSGCSKLIKEIGEHPKVQITSKLWDCAEMKMCRKQCSEELFFEFAKGNRLDLDFEEIKGVSVRGQYRLVDGSA